VGQALSLTAKYFRESQRDDGSWTYNTGPSRHKHSMTCAGLLSLATDRGAPPGYIYVRNISPRIPTVVSDPAITRGFRFLGKAFDTIANGGAIDSWGRLYFLWSLERVTGIYGLETIGSREWYPWTAELLVRIQQGDGSWSGDGPRPVATCFALLILRRSNLTPDLLVGVPGLTQPRKPTGLSGKPVQEPSSPRAPTPGPWLGSKPDADTSTGPPLSRVPDPPNRLNRTVEKKD
jgi:hypothetical protein